MKNHYIQATVELIQSGTDVDKVLSGLKSSLKKNGHMKLYASVLRGVLRVLETHKNNSQAQVIVAKDTDLQKYADTIKETLTKIGSKEDFSTKIDDTIIGGIIIKSNNTVVDKSYKTTLTNLYRSITS